MKSVVAFVTFLAIATIAFAQPTLTGANSNPVPGDRFFGKYCNTTGVSKGASGAGVTWNLSTLVATDFDTTIFVPCVGTAFCDTFPGSTVAVEYDGDFDYYRTDASKFVYNGYGASGGCAYYSDPATRLAYPMSFNSFFVDSYAMQQPAFQTYSYGIDSIFADAWGTLILPSGTYSNVLRVRYISYGTDSFAFTTPAVVEHRRAEQYCWFMPGFHYPLLMMYYDTSGSGTLSLKDVGYFTQPPTLVGSTNASSNKVAVYPNPADNFTSLQIESMHTCDATITTTDMLGRAVGNVVKENLPAGKTELRYDLSGLPPGMYVLSIVTPYFREQKKVQVLR